MKNSLRLFTILSAVLTISAIAQTTEKKAALRNVAEKPARYVTMIPHGGLNGSSTTVGERQIFTIMDTNGGELSDGDDVLIKYVTPDEKETSYWQEKGEVISRDRKAVDSAHFKVKKTDAGISLRTASGKFVAIKGKTDPLGVTDAADKAAVFEVVENPAMTPQKESKEPAKEEPKKTDETKE